MGVSKTVIKEGTGETPVKGQTVTIEYTGWLKDESKPNNKGKQYVSAPCFLRTSLSLVKELIKDSFFPTPDSILPSAAATLLSRLASDRSSRVCRWRIRGAGAESEFQKFQTISNAVNAGWDDGVTQMRVGEKATLDISADSGYGARYVSLCPDFFSSFLDTDNGRAAASPTTSLPIPRSYCESASVWDSAQLDAYVVLVTSS